MLFRNCRFCDSIGMKKMIFVICILVSSLFGGECFAELHPVEGSDNYLETDDPPTTSDCVDLEFVFARGSGAEYQKSEIWLKYRDAMEDLARRRNYKAEVLEVEYPAVSVIDPFTTAIGAFASAGEYYRFGKSVQVGID